MLLFPLFFIHNSEGYKLCQIKYCGLAIAAPDQLIPDT